METVLEQRRVPDRSAYAGFTLLEAIIVMILLGIFAAVAVPRAGGLFSSEPQLARYQNELIGDLRRARAVAMGCGERRAFEVDLAWDGSAAWAMDTADEPCQGLRTGPDLSSGFQVSASPVTTFVYRYPNGDIAEGEDAERLEEDLEITLEGDDGRSRAVCIRSLTGVVERGEC